MAAKLAADQQESKRFLARVTENGQHSSRVAARTRDQGSAQNRGASRRNHRPVQNREGTTIGREPVRNLAIIVSLEHRQVCVLAMLNGTLSVAKSQRPGAV